MWESDFEDVLDAREARMDVLIRFAGRISFAEFGHFAGNTLRATSESDDHTMKRVIEITDMRAGDLSIALHSVTQDIYIRQ